MIEIQDSPGLGTNWDGWSWRSLHAGRADVVGPPQQPQDRVRPPAAAAGSMAGLGERGADGAERKLFD